MGRPEYVDGATAGVSVACGYVDADERSVSITIRYVLSLQTCLSASDYAERALYALDRCLAPSFNVSSGTCRLDFNRVENRPMFMALHRIISYLGRRGCWVTAFNFAKLLFSLDPMVGHLVSHMLI